MRFEETVLNCGERFELYAVRSCFSKTFEKWLSLINTPELSTYQDCIQIRFEEAMPPALAYITDPTINKKQNVIPKSNEDAAYKWLENLYPEFVTGIIFYNVRDKNVCNQFFERFVNEPIQMVEHYEENI